MSRDEAALAVANRLAGKLSERSSATKVNKHELVYQAAMAALESAAGTPQSLSRRDLASLDAQALARKAAEQVLMERLPRAQPHKRDELRRRIALIRAGEGGDLPEYQSALLIAEAKT